MRSYESPHLVDWLAVSLRWLALVSAALMVGNDDTAPPLAINALLGAAAFWNVILTTLAGARQQLHAHRMICVAGDAIFAYLLFLLSGGLTGQFIWIGVVPLMSAALYFGLRGALAVTLINLVVQGLISLLHTHAPSLLIALPVMLGLYLVIGILFSFMQRGVQSVLAVAGKGGSEKKSEIETEQRRVLYQIITTLSSTLNYQKVLDSALDMSTSAVLPTNGKAASRFVSAVLLFSGKEAAELHVVSARGFTPADMRTPLLGEKGLVGKAIDEATPVLSQDISQDPELNRYTGLHHCKSAYCIPLRTGLNVCGVLLFGSTNPNFFVPEQREILEIIANQAMVALENARLYQSLEAEKERMMEIQEEARKKMARDLHDGPTQSVAAIAMRVNFARRLMERDQKAAADELYKIEDLARRTTKEIRHMLFTLRPLVLESQGLIAALESMAEKTEETYNQKVIIQAEEALINELEMGKQGVIFSIAEEAVNNARKHARAPHIWVRLKRVEKDFIMLEIEDDGIGFNVSEVDASYDNRGSLGLVNMRERSELVNGTLRLESTPGRGARVKVLIPLTEDAADRLRRGT